MKSTESLFFDNFKSLTVTPDELEVLKDPQVAEISKNHLLDLSPPPGLYFSIEVQNQISHQAAVHLIELYRLPGHSQSLSQLWRQVVTDFHRNQRWGYQASHKTKPKPPLTTEQKISRELFPYVWALVQAVVIMKAAVYYFGMQSSNEPSTQNDLFFGLALLISFGSLFVFAWRKTRQEKTGLS